MAELKMPAKDKLLSADTYEEALKIDNKLVVSDRCGGGKTLSMGEFMSRRPYEGHLYVAERNEQLDNMAELLIKKFNIPEEYIQIYNTHTESKSTVRNSLVNIPIVLVTHARLLIDEPTDFCRFATGNRGFLIIDESVNMATIMRIPYYYVQGVLANLNIKLGVKLSNQEALSKLPMIRNSLIKIAKTNFYRQGIIYPPLQSMSSNAMSTSAKQFVLERTFQQILMGNFSLGNLEVFVPLALHHAWSHIFKNVIILDATARYTPFLYNGFYMIGREFDFSLIENIYDHFSDFKLTKGGLKKNMHTFLDNDLISINRAIEGFFKNPYIVTFKDFESEIRYKLSKPVVHYGMTRGSNEFLNSDGVVLIGSYRFPSHYLNIAKGLYPDLDETAIPIANWIQEIYRSRIRNGHPINIIFLGDNDAKKRFKSVIGRASKPLGISMSPREIVEKALRQDMTKARKAILIDLKEKGYSNLKEVAKKYTGRDLSKAKRAYNGLVGDKPVISQATHIVDDIVRMRPTLAV
jgi:hypothetical protein